MERLEKSDPNAVKPLTDGQKKELADLESTYRAKIAEREVFLAGKLREAEASGDRVAADQVRQQLSNERIRLEEERDEKKNAIRESGA